MGKKKQRGNLGKSIIRDRFGIQQRKIGDNSFLHTSELNDGYDWGRLNLRSVTEQSNLEEFLATAELAGTEFTAEKLNVKFVDPGKHSGLLSAEDQVETNEAQSKHRQFLTVPRRPLWNESTTPEELDASERNTFLEWRRQLSTLQDVKHLVLTPYEKNLDFWRQLWRVMERSDILVQIVDARNPLLFHCTDLESYLKEVDPTKVNLLLLNKADYLTEDQRKTWAEYFEKEGILVAFWSALLETKRQDENSEESTGDEGEPSSIPIEDAMDSDEDPDSDKDADAVTANRGEEMNIISSNADAVTANRGEEMNIISSNADAVTANRGEEMNIIGSNADAVTANRGEEMNIISSNAVAQAANKQMEIDISSCAESCDVNADRTTGDVSEDVCQMESASAIKNSHKLLLGPELLDLLRSLHHGHKAMEGVTTVGMVGYPNVGKSSTINSILQMKKVPVSTTPGRTKHFQTLFVDPELMLCDCPGLVFPSFVSTKAELIVNGVLPVDHMKDHIPPTALICQRIPRPLLQRTYGINIPIPMEGEDPSRCPTAYELLNTYAAMRGFMTARGVPDCPRASRYILKDYISGKILFCHCPPGVDENMFQSYETTSAVESSTGEIIATKHMTAVPNPSRIDQDFFSNRRSEVHSMGVHGTSAFARIDGVRHVSSQSAASSPYGSQTSVSGKPWKKHNNHKKKEKLRRVHSDLDK